MSNEIARDFPELMHALADALRPILPNGISASSDDKHVIIHTRHGYDWLPVVDSVEANVGEWSTDEAIEVAVNSCLDVLQDVVAKHLTEPWPHPPDRFETARPGADDPDAGAQLAPKASPAPRTLARNALRKSR